MTLNLKNLSPAKRLTTLFASLLICLSQLFITQATLANPSAPDAMVAEFYGWYLHTLATDHDPMQDEKAKFSTYVSRALTVEIERKMKSADGLNADYFIQTQDYHDDWEKNISVAKPIIKGNGATLAVTLGASKESTYRLNLSLVKDGDTWKIRKVVRGAR